MGRGLMKGKRREGAPEGGAGGLLSSGGEPVICDSAQHTTWVA